ncbi:hypothetical protein [Natrialba magadii]|uniref:hypothetical protein n=1 Tax=Natrialba magadii TaxID=13769 RepID=UPI00019740A6|nr:hypothetical protein [Natrialba magadii]
MTKVVAMEAVLFVTILDTYLETHLETDRDGARATGPKHDHDHDHDTKERIEE